MFNGMFDLFWLSMNSMSPYDPTYTLQSTGKFPHTRAQLSAIARQFKPQDIDTDPDDDHRVSQSFVNQIVSLLVDEKEDDLKIILKTTFAMDDDSVRVIPLPCNVLNSSTGRAKRLGPDAQASRRCCWRTLPLPNSDAPTDLEAIVPCIHPFSSLSSIPRHSFFSTSFPSRSRIS